jgi:3-hydroxyacyl-[acyl-carrier-protein] dehydratase
MSPISSRLLSVDSVHPSLPGHFPGMPVVPGVVFLSFILDEVRRQLPPVRVTGVRKLKFLQMLLPQQSFVVKFCDPEPGSLRFKCWRAASSADSLARVLLVDGNLQLAPSVTSPEWVP